MNAIPGFLQGDNGDDQGDCISHRSKFVHG